MTEHTPMTQERLDAIRKRLNETSWSTDHPWKVWDDGLTLAVYFDTPHDGIQFVCDHFPYNQHQGESDATFVAHAPDDLAALLAEVQRLRHFESIVSWRYGDTTDGMTREDMIERAARALWRRDKLSSDDAKWNRVPEIVREFWRQDARATLDAALSTGEGA